MWAFLDAELKLFESCQICIKNLASPRGCWRPTFLGLQPAFNCQSDSKTSTEISTDPLSTKRRSIAKKWFCIDLLNFIFCCFSQHYFAKRLLILVWFLKTRNNFQFYSAKIYQE